MPLIEDTEYEALRAKAQQADLAMPSKALLDKLGANPKTRRQMLELMKEVNPNLVIPELDAAKPVLDKVAELEKKLADREKAESDKQAESDKRARERDASETISKARKRLSQDGWTSEGIADLEKLMETRGLTDYDAAAALYEKEHPPEETVLPSNYTRSWDMFAPPEDNADIKAAVGLPKGAAQERALKVWQNKEINKWFAENRARSRVRA